MSSWCCLVQSAEVKVRDNYDLKEDDYLESEKRMKVFEQRI